MAAPVPWRNTKENHLDPQQLCGNDSLSQILVACEQVRGCDRSLPR